MIDRSEINTKQTSARPRSKIVTTLDDFYGDGSADNTPECSFCGNRSGKLIVSISDHYGPTHWHHAACKARSDARGQALAATTIAPTWDEAMDGSQAGEKSICYTCRVEIVGNVIEVSVSPIEIHFHCEGCFAQLQNAKLSSDVDYLASQYQTIC